MIKATGTTVDVRAIKYPEPTLRGGREEREAERKERGRREEGESKERGRREEGERKERAQVRGESEVQISYSNSINSIAKERKAEGK